MALTVLAAFALGLLLYLTVGGDIEYHVAQTIRYSSFRKALALGTAPTGPLTRTGQLLPVGTPVALLHIPSIGLTTVVGEGTTPEALLDGPGHFRGTPLPGQPGISEIIGRETAFGGPFSRIHDLKPGAIIDVTVGFGTNFETFKVLDVRSKGDPVPPYPKSGESRLVLTTGMSWLPYIPSGLVYVDADLVSKVQPAAVSTISPSALPRDEYPGNGDTSTLWALALWLEALGAVVAVWTWAWYRWGRWRTWVALTPPLVLIGYFVADQVARTLPNVS